MIRILTVDKRDRGDCFKKDANTESPETYIVLFNELKLPKLLGKKTLSILVGTLNSHTHKLFFFHRSELQFYAFFLVKWSEFVKYKKINKCYKVSSLLFNSITLY